MLAKVNPSYLGFGSSVLYSIKNWNTDNQFRFWYMYPLIAFIIVSILAQINYLTKSLQHFSTSIVTPLNFVFFSTFTLITSAVLYKGFNVDNANSGATLILGLTVIFIGVALLFQYQLKLNKLSKAAFDTALDQSSLKDANHTEEQMDESEEQDPITLMQDIFPLKTYNHSLSFRTARSMDSIPHSKSIIPVSSIFPNELRLRKDYAEQGSQTELILNRAEPVIVTVSSSK
jgi:hypothetical protein